MMANKRKDYLYNEMYGVYLSGLSLSEVGRKFGMTRQSVYSGFKKRGFELRSSNPRESVIVDGIKFSLRNNGYMARTNGDRKQLHRYIWEKYRGPIPDGYDIHHIDHNKLNNHINNLEIYTKSEHTRIFHTPKKTGEKLCSCGEKAELIQITLFGEVPYCAVCYDVVTNQREMLN